MRLYTRAGSPYLYVDVTINGTRYRRPTGETDRGRAQEAAGRIAEDLRRTAPPERRTDLGLLELSAADIARAESGGAGTEQIKSLRRTWNHILDLLGEDRDPCTITFDLIEDYVGRRRQEETGRKRADGTRETARGQSIRHETQALRRGLAIAKRRGWIRDIPEFPKVKKSPKSEKQRGHFIPPEILTRWLDELPGEARDESLVTLLTGLRCEELHRVQHAWIEPVEEREVPAILRIPDWASKTKAERIVGLVDESLAILERRTKDGAVPFPLTSGTHRQARRGAAKRVGWPRTIHLRDLRHTHSTIAGEDGDPAAIQAALGHADLRTTNTYLSSTINRTAGVAVSVAGVVGRHNRAAHTQPASDRSAKPSDEGVETRGIEPLTSWLQISSVVPQALVEPAQPLFGVDAPQHGPTPIVADRWHSDEAQCRPKRKRLTPIGKCLGFIVNREHLDALGFDRETPLVVRVEGDALVIRRDVEAVVVEVEPDVKVESA